MVWKHRVFWDLVVNVCMSRMKTAVARSGDPCTSPKRWCQVVDASAWEFLARYTRPICLNGGTEDSGLLDCCHADKGPLSFCMIAGADSCYT